MYASHLEPLESRSYLAVTASFAAGQLTVLGDGDNNSIVVSRNAGGTIFVNGGAVAITGGPATIANTTLIHISGLGGNDNLALDETNGALPRAKMLGGSGNDTMNGGAGNDDLDGGDGNDQVDGNRGDDVAALGAGDDTFIWDPGDGSDEIDGQGNTDTMRFNGANGAENIDISNNSGDLRFFRDAGTITMDADNLEIVDFRAKGGADNIVVNNLAGTDVTQVKLDLSLLGDGTAGDGVADSVTVKGTSSSDNVAVTGAGDDYGVGGLPAAVDVVSSETANDSLAVNLAGGNDRFTAATLPNNIVGLTVDGGAGGDQIFGSPRAETLFGGSGNDTIDGNQGNDTAFMGSGNDVFIWDPGDGSDVVEGEGNTDTLLFNGANVAENIDMAANGVRFRFFRDAGNITMDVDDTERVVFNARGGADNIVINDLTITDVIDIKIDLANPEGSDSGDGQIDKVTVTGTQAADEIDVSGGAEEINVLGLFADVEIQGHESALDQVIINAQSGDDLVNAPGLASGTTTLIVNGGAGVDTTIGSKGADIVTGGDGNDIAFLAGGDDTFIWNPGDDNDIIEGGNGTDTMLFNGANVAENIDISANGDRLRFFRDIANVTMDANDTEVVTFNALGGADTIVVNDLSATEVTRVEINLASAIGGNTPDGAVDNVIVNGTNDDDDVTVTGTAGTGVQVSGLQPLVTITTPDPTDRLTVNGRAGDDTIDASGLNAGVMLFLANGEAGDDDITGSAGDDTLSGGDDDDTLTGGPGTDVLDGGAGNNTVVQ